MKKIQIFVFGIVVLIALLFLYHDVLHVKAQQTVVPTITLRAVCYVTSTTAYAVGDSATLARSTDGGKT